MVFQIIPTEDFRLDLDGAYRYLKSAVCAQGAAKKLRDAVKVAEANLRLNPLMMHISYDFDLASKDCREYPVRSYVIVYRIVGNEVQLLRLFHQRQLKVMHQQK